MHFRYFPALGITILLFIAGNSTALSNCNSEDWVNMIQSDNAVQYGPMRSGGLGAYPDSDEEAASMMASIWNWVIAQSSYDAPRTCPRIEFRSAEFFTENLCPSGAYHCGVGGYYQDSSGTIIIRNDHLLDDERVRAVLAHEFIHYLQDQSGIWREKSCRNKILREREAYGLQQSYLVAHHGNPFGIRIPVLDESLCSERIN